MQNGRLIAKMGLKMRCMVIVGCIRSGESRVGNSPSKNLYAIRGV
ncbi:hypothetical protein R7035_20940 [Vibrio sp. 1731]|nr:hypothetical protein [Vibrio sp. 1731]MDW2115982.1 hypothetical protein [Vibrio sp. 1731]